MRQGYREMEHEDRVMVLSCLPEAGLLATVEAHVKMAFDEKVDPAKAAQGILWLESFVKGGFLEVADGLAWDPSVTGGRGMNTRANEEALSRRCRLLSALMSFSKNSKLVSDFKDDPSFGELDRSCVVLEFPVPDGLARVFSLAMERLAADDEGFFAASVLSQEDPKDFVRNHRGLAFTTWEEREQTFAKAMSLCCMVGLPDSLALLAVRCPEALTACVELAPFLGDVPKNPRDNRALAFTPYFCAVQFSQPACMDALMDLGVPGDAPLTKLWLADSQSGLHTAFEIDSFLLHNAPLCNPSTLAKALVLHEQSGRLKNPEIHDLVVTALGGEKFFDLEGYLPAFLQAGRVDFDKDGGSLVRLACENGFQPLLGAMEVAGKIPWGSISGEEDLPDSVVFDRVAEKSSVQGGFTQEKVQHCLLFLMDAAERAGTLDGLLRPYGSKISTSTDLPGPFFHPMDALIQSGFEQILMRLMRAGLDPQAPYEPITSLSPVQIAEIRGKGKIAHTMRTFASHSRAMKALESMHLETEGPHP